jgi:hypothetical protein
MRRTYVTEDVGTIEADSGSALIRWSAIFGGLILGLGLLMVLTSLFLALAYGSGINDVRDNLSWFIGGSAIAALFVGAILTGYLSGVRSAGTGMLHGFALWGLLLALTLTVGIPSILNVFNLGTVVTQATQGLTDGDGSTALWASFWTLAGGFFAAGIGGALGGAMSRGARTHSRTVERTDDEIEAHRTYGHDHDHDDEVVEVHRDERALDDDAIVDDTRTTTVRRS